MAIDDNSLEETPVAELKPVEPPPPEVQLSDEETARRAEYEQRKQELLAQLEKPESRFSQLARSKSFWYAVFGVMFFIIMSFIISWASRDIYGSGR